MPRTDDDPALVLNEPSPPPGESLPLTPDGSPGGAARPDPDAAASLAARETRIGVVYALAAYGTWVVVAFYFKAVSSVPAHEVLAHRMVWSFVLLAAMARLYGRLRDAVAAVRDARVRNTLILSSLLVGTNWFTFIYSVESGQLIQASLGYFINPLVSVLLGFVFLKERLRAVQWVAVGLAAAGVTYLAVSYGQAPTIALVLAFSFGLYGLLRKTVRADALVGLTVETAFLAPLALVYLGWLGASGHGAFGAASWSITLLLPLSGVVTAAPLLWFANAARRLRLATVGLLQYIAPTGQLLVAVAAFGETFLPAHGVSFGLIWTGLALYSIDAIRNAPRRGKRIARQRAAAR